jgi:hypothetical protein
MNTQSGRRQDAACIIVSIDRERSFWQNHYTELPCGQARLGFDACWPLLARAYDIYLHHPNVGRDVGAVMYANSPEVVGQALESNMAMRIFSRVMDRIHRATTRLEYPHVVQA